MAGTFLSPSEASLVYDFLSDVYYNDDYTAQEREAAYTTMQALDTTFGCRIVPADYE